MAHCAFEVGFAATSLLPPLRRNRTWDKYLANITFLLGGLAGAGWTFLLGRSPWWL
jgi:hypothetical protein